jgi:hypothetical protein
VNPIAPPVAADAIAVIKEPEMEEAEVERKTETAPAELEMEEEDLTLSKDKQRTVAALPLHPKLDPAESSNALFLEKLFALAM